MEECTHIIRISKESNPRNHTRTNMIPSKRCLINLGERKSPPLIRILHVCELRVKSAKDGVAATATAAAILRLQIRLNHGRAHHRVAKHWSDQERQTCQLASFNLAWDQFACLMKNKRYQERLVRLRWIPNGWKEGSSRGGCQETLILSRH